MTLNILLCDTYLRICPKEMTPYGSIYKNPFDSVNSTVTYHLYNVYNNEFPSHLRSDEIYLIIGSNMSIYEEKAWIKNLISFIRGAHSMKIPLAGINFGHLAIAYALGGKVTSPGTGWGTGIRESQIVDPVARRYFSSNQLILHYNHYEQVTELPRGAVRFATSDFCKNEGFVLNNHILTFQGHIEYTDATICNLIQNDSTDDSKEVKEKALNSIQQYGGRTMGREVARWILDLKKSVDRKSILNRSAVLSFF